MPIVNSTLKLSLEAAVLPTGEVLEVPELIEEYRTYFEHEKTRQNQCIQDNFTLATRKTQFSNHASRQLSVTVPTLPNTRLKYNQDTNTRTEAYRLISTYNKRKPVAEWLDINGWNTKYENRPKEFRYVKRQLWVNIQRSGELPSKPVVETPRLVLSKLDNLHTKTIKQEGQYLYLHTAIMGIEYIGEFKIPDLQYEYYKDWKPTKPTVQIDKDGKLSFLFSMKKNIKEEKITQKSTLGVDLGLVKPIAMSRVYEDNTFDIIGGISLPTYQDYKKAMKRKEHYSNTIEKNKRREKLGVVNEDALATQEFLRLKNERANESLDWNTATDVLDEVKAGEFISLEQLNWSSGGPVKFRHASVGDKINHLASKDGVRVVRVDAKNTSRECPLCNDSLRPDNKRVSICSNSDCDWVGDRDDTSGVIVGKRGLGSKLKKKDRTKGSPTPKRPKPSKRRKVSRRMNLSSRAGFTGPCSIIATGVDNATDTATIVGVNSEHDYSLELSIGST